MKGRIEMGDMTRRSVLGASAAAAAALIGSEAIAQEAKAEEGQSAEQAGREKLRSAGLSVAPAAPKKWNTTTRNTPQDVVTFVNAAPAQVAGEISVTRRADGTYDIFYFL